MAKGTFTMLTGIPGAGKSWYSDKIQKQDPNAVVLSSDAIREELYGDASVQQNPRLVFQLMFERSVQALRDGKHVVYDATNLNANTRTRTLENVMREAHPAHTECVWVYRTPERCREANKTRNRHVPDDVITRMEKSFQIPTKKEGWDSIRAFNPELNRPVDIYIANAELKADALKQERQKTDRSSAIADELMK